MFKSVFPRPFCTQTRISLEESKPPEAWDRYVANLTMAPEVGGIELLDRPTLFGVIVGFPNAFWGNTGAFLG